MDDAETALRLFLTRDPTEAHRFAAEMERHNSDRRAAQEAMLIEAIEQAEVKVSQGAKVLVISEENWNAGVVGIVAGRICELYGRPTILISRDPESGMGGGSARSIDKFNIVEALRLSADLLAGFGGHALAAGLSLPLENLDALEERLNDLASEIITDEDLLPRIEVEAKLEPSDITRQLAERIRDLEPFGEGNPEPLFMSTGMSSPDPAAGGGWLTYEAIGSGQEVRSDQLHRVQDGRLGGQASAWRNGRFVLPY